MGTAGSDPEEPDESGEDDVEASDSGAESEDTVVSEDAGEGCS